MKDKYFFIDLLVIVLILLYAILVIINNKHASIVGIVGFGLFGIRSLQRLIEERRAKNKTK